MNTLYPIFLKAEQLQWLVVGGGNVALEKLTFLYKSSPAARVRLVAPEIKPQIVAMAATHPLELIQSVYDPIHLNGVDLVIATTDNPNLNSQIHTTCRERNILANVADTPACCDFYLGGIATKGDLKIAISTNGKSPTLAKRLRELFEAIFPEDIQELLDQMQLYRQNLKGSFEEKVKQMNELTKHLIQEQKQNDKN